MALAPALSRCLVATLREAGWAPAAVIALQLLLTQGFDAYRQLPDIDVPMHLLGGLATAHLLHRGFLHASRLGIIGPHHRLTHALLVMGGTCAVAVFWEFGEYLNDALLGSRSLGTVGDTLGDIFLGLLGGGGLVGRWWLAGSGSAGTD